MDADGFVFFRLFEGIFGDRPLRIDAQAQRPLHRDAPIAELLVVENPADLAFLHIEENADDFLSDVRGQLAVFVAHVLTERRFHRSGIDQLDFSLAAFLFFVGEYPDIGANPRVVEHILRQSDNGFYQVVFNHISASIALSAAGIACENR